MKLSINWNDPILPEEAVLQITPSCLDDFYGAASETQRLNLFFVLLASFHRYEHRAKEGAHLCFLMAYYLFITLTPPASQELALYYIRRALALNPQEEYKTWESLIEKGN